jgi:hypothetical protein
MTCEVVESRYNRILFQAKFDSVLVTGDHDVRLVFVHGKMLRWEAIYRNIDVRRSPVCSAPETRRCRVEVPKRQGALDFSISDEVGKQKSGVEGGKQSQEAIKGEEGETDWGLPVC